MKKQSVIQLATALGIFLSVCATAAVPQKVNQFTEGERVIYTRLVQAFHAAKLEDLIKQRQVLERNYPQSIHLDNAYYLTGMLQFQKEHFTEALKSFDVVRDKYIKSNKRPSALFGIAMTYKRLNLVAQEQRVLQKIISEYPGSQESQRAWMSLRMQKEVGKTPTVKR